MAKKHAYLISAHENPNQLKTLIELLDNSLNDIYVHIDKDAVNFPMRIFDGLTKKSALILVPRISVRWAHYSQTELQFRMLEKAVNNYSGEGYSYYHFISGMDLPLKTQSEIHEFFDNSGRREFMAIVPKEGDYQLRHVKYAFPLLKLKRYRKSKFLKTCSEIGATLQKTLRIDRTYGKNPEDWVFVDGWDWFSITNSFAQYVLEKESTVYKLFHLGKASSEMAFQTVLWNSEFRNNLADIYDMRKGSSRYIDWNRG